MTASLTVADDFGQGGSGLAPQGAHGEPSLRDLLRHPAGRSVGAVDFNGAAVNAETFAIAMANGAIETWTKVAAETNPFEFDGGTANAQAVAFAAAVNTDSLFLQAIIVADTVILVALNPGLTGSLVAGNGAITNGLTNVTAPATMEHAEDAARKELRALTHVPNASEVALGAIHIPLPFVPQTWAVRVYVTATGAEKDAGGTDHANYDGNITVGTNPDRLIIGQGTTLAWAATDTLHVEVCS